MKKQPAVKEEETKPAQFTQVQTSRDIADYRDTWRIFRIMAELVEGYQFLAEFSNEVTILGSARFLETDKYYKVSYELGKLLGKKGFTTITGGGGGIMEAANRGAAEVGGVSVGLNIQLPFEQKINKYVAKSTSFYYFFTRKVMLTSPANAFVIFPGGFGTFDEFFEIVDLMDQKLMAKVPVVLVGSEYWRPLIDFLKINCAQIGSVPLAAIESWHIVDTAEEAFEYLKDAKEISATSDLSPNSFQCKGKIDWKIFRIMAELVEGFEFLTGLTHAVTVLGTKSIMAGDDYYHQVYEMGQTLALKGYSVVTGAKFGIAEAANKGAFEAGGNSIGIGMKMGDMSEEVNPYLNKSILFQFPFTRKLIITAPTKAFIFFPGGFGTMHQLFEVLTLIQTKKIKKRPVILVDHKFWEPLHEIIKKHLYHDVGTISDEDDEIYQIVDSVQSAMKVLKI